MELRELAFKQLKSLQYFQGIIKVRLNHLGKIIQVGEY